jgi:hypothetical protein
MFTKFWFGSWITDGDKGFSVRYGRDFAVYREGDRQLTLSIDVGGNGAIIIVGSGARWMMIQAKASIPQHKWKLSKE